MVSACYLPVGKSKPPENNQNFLLLFPGKTCNEQDKNLCLCFQPIFSILGNCYGRAQVQQIQWVRSGPIRSLADKYTVMVVKAFVKLLTNTLNKTLSAFNLPD